MQTPIITIWLASSLAVLFVLLSFRVSLLRQKFQAPFGDAGNPTLMRAVRAHGNLGESAPLVLILLLLLETMGTTLLFSIPLASIYFAGRFLAAIASTLPGARGEIARPITMLTTLLPLLILSIMLLRHAF